MVELYKQNYNENKKLYNKIAKQLKEKIPNDIPINHVGSTSIPYMYGKDIIDILIGIPNEKDMDKYSKIIKNLGYYPGSHSKGIYRFFASTEEETKKGDIHLHLVYINTKRYNDFLILKNYLLTNKNERKYYSNFKKNLISKGIINREEYKKIKSEYVEKLIERANDIASKKD